VVCTPPVGLIRFEHLSRVSGGMRMESTYSLAEKSPAVFWDEQYGLSKAASAGMMKRHSASKVARRAETLRPERAMTANFVGVDSVVVCIARRVRQDVGCVNRQVAVSKKFGGAIASREVAGGGRVVVDVDVDVDVEMYSSESRHGDVYREPVTAFSSLRRASKAQARP